MDNLKVHHAKAVTRRVGERPDRIELFYPPPHTPERNPTEDLNRDFKTHLRLGQCSRTPNALRQKAEAFLQLLRDTPERVKAYFNHAAVQYANHSPI